MIHHRKKPVSAIWLMQVSVLSGWGLNLFLPQKCMIVRAIARSYLSGTANMQSEFRKTMSPFVKIFSDMNGIMMKDGKKHDKIKITNKISGLLSLPSGRERSVATA